MKSRNKRSSLIALILICLLTLTTLIGGVFGVTVGDYRTVTIGESIIKGLDLQGGTSVLLEVQAQNIGQQDLERVRELINMRVNSTGATDATITTEGTNRIRVDIPGEYQTKEIVDNLSKTGTLTFKDEAGKVVLQGTDIESAGVGIDDTTGGYIVNLKMKDSGVTKFADATKANIGKKISINMDDEMLSNPVVNQVISNGSAQISGQKDEKEAKMLAAMINNGALPYPVKAVSIKNVGATLGTSVLPAVKIAGILGFLAIFAIMIYFYRIPGIMSSIALVIFALLLLLLTVKLKISMSLAGIAGYLLSIGMAVDANILIFERIKEVLKNKVDHRTAIHIGFKEAMSSILDANITTLISGFILYYVGSGTVRGFALNLVLGVVISMFTAIIVTRILVNLAYNIGWLNNDKAFGITDKKEFSFDFPFFERRNVFFILSAIVIGAGLIAGIVLGPNMGIDFAGGTQVAMNMSGKTFTKSELDDILKKYDESASTQVNEGSIYEIRSNKLNTAGFDPFFKEVQAKYQGGAEMVNSIDEIGAAIGTEQTKKAIWASILSIIAILAYVAVRFKFTLGVGAIAALVHDVLFTLAIYFMFRIPINSPFIAAILTIIGYSINDTVVIFDRIRENLKLNKNAKLEEVTNKSISQTMVRTINTSLTVFVILVLMLIFVPQIRDFTLPLLLGTISGVYSTVFIASPIYVMLEKKLNKEKREEGIKNNKTNVKNVNSIVSDTSKINIENDSKVDSNNEVNVRKTSKDSLTKKYSNKYKKKEKAPVKKELDPYSLKRLNEEKNNSKIKNEDTNNLSEVNDIPKIKDDNSKENI